VLAGILILALVAFWIFRWRREHSQDANILFASQRYQVDPGLVKAVVWRESGFDPASRGRAGEMGLMQIRSAAAAEWARDERLPFETIDFFDAKTNILAGTWYLRKALRRYTETDDAVPFGLADYNAGRANVLRWKRGVASTNSLAFIEAITFPSTKSYVNSIRQRRPRYREEFEAMAPKK
jgi:soluble lytic murein transglycosylase